MLKLKQVSKFYYNKGLITSGFNKVNLELNLGEFVAITGESGSGKSTLLNVLAGLDSYEEGELYIDSKETSHYSESDFEVYRKKYIGNIFQNFNLVNSYTVYQNVELVLLINGFKKRKVKTKILDILKQVDMYKYRNSKVSKLSGGQKQRVAIARALAKDTPIILADEPTGNLDIKSAESIVKLLSDISETKLVIIVTHNYEQIEKYVTRKIVMHDGKIIEDTNLKKYKEVKTVVENKFRETSFFNKIRLGVRNTFNIIPKFLLILFVYLFVILSLSSAYSSFKKGEYESSMMGYNSFFQNKSDKRIVIKKADSTPFTNDDYLKISKINNIDKIIYDDVSLDNSISVTDSELYFSGLGLDIKDFEGKIDLGRMPENENEVILEALKDDYYIYTYGEQMFERNFYYQNKEGIENKNRTLKIVGIKYMGEGSLFTAFSNSKFYFNSAILEEKNKENYISYSKINFILSNTQFESKYSMTNKIVPSTIVPRGQVYIYDALSYLCKDEYCFNYNLSVNVSNLYFKESINLTVTKIYDKYNFASVMPLKFEDYDGAIFINNEDYNSLFNKGYFQSSVFVKNVKDVRTTISDLQNAGFNTLYIKDTLSSVSETVIFIKIAKVVLLSIMMLILFFITYFIIKLILKSRNVYFSTIRILGASSKTTTKFLDIELLLITNIAYIIFISLALLVNYKYIEIDYIKNLIEYIQFRDYIIIYVMVIVLSFLESRRYSSNLFKNSAMKAYKEEV